MGLVNLDGLEDNKNLENKEDIGGLWGNVTAREYFGVNRVNWRGMLPCGKKES